ncbi:MAG: phosphomannomutase/phosphoglucomutase [Proteobacteria bacterium]|nr:phosphomannomutase/phosphoglucomutase [Pseudomonadota bacterium]
MKTIDQNIFKSYDIRGIVDTQLNTSIVFEIARAIGTETQLRQRKNIIVARDARLSSPELAKAAIEGLRSTGCDVTDIGEVPTPVLYFATNTLGIDSGIMITGSHNPANYNGIKMVLAGETLANQKIQALYTRIQNQDFLNGAGSYCEKPILDAYLNHIVEHIHLPRRLKVVIDCGNGVASVIAPQLFKALGCDVIELFCECDGRFPNHHPDPSVPKNLETLIETVLKNKADVGFAFDGDGDRLGVVTNQGEIIWPDRLMMLFAKDVLSRHPNAPIVYDVKCSKHLITWIKQHGGQATMAQTGHSLIKARMREIESPLAGEMSGHIFFQDRWFGSDDGVYSAARLLEILAQSSKSLSTICQALPNSTNTPEIKIAIPEEQKFSFIETFKRETTFFDAELITIDGLRVEYPNGWGLIRASNTTSHLILRFEADTVSALEKIQSIFKEQILKVNDQLSIPF